MRVPVWAHALAREFWQAAGQHEGFPRELEEAIEAAYPLSVKRLAGLTFDAIRSWFERLDIAVDALPDRRLCGCLAVSRGSGMIFVDADDAPAEQRYTLAHELAHFLRDVRRPRDRMAWLFGDSEIADGRPPSQEERFAAIIEGVDVGVHVHLLERDAQGRPATAEIRDAEESADVLAFELLAPASHLASRAENWSVEELIDHLANDYGLPKTLARRYAVQLRPPAPRPDAWIEVMT